MCFGQKHGVLFLLVTSKLCGLIAYRSVNWAGLNRVAAVLSAVLLPSRLRRARTRAAIARIYLKFRESGGARGGAGIDDAQATAGCAGRRGTV
jgi:hypothetical protein